MLVIWAILHFSLAFMLMALINWAGLIAWRRSAAAHWTERARLLWPVRITGAFATLLVPISLVELHSARLTQSWPLLWINGIAGFGGALLGGYPLEHEMFPALDFPNWCHQVVAGWGFRFGVSVLFFLAVLLMPNEMGWSSVWVAGGYLTIHLLIQFGLFIKYLRLVKFLKPAGPRLHTIVSDLTLRMAVKVRATWQSGGNLASAFALPTTHELMFSDRLLEICDDGEVAAICAHELAHLTESKAVLAGRLLGSLGFFPLIFVKPAIHYWGFAGISLPYAIMLLIFFFSRKLGHRMEKRADAVAFQEQINEGVYARGLEKIYRENQLPAVHTGKNIVHPHLYDRLLAAGVTPDYPRPEKPQKMTVAGGLTFAGLVLLISVVASWFRALAR